MKSSTTPILSYHSLQPPFSAGEEAYDTATLGKVLSEINLLRPENKHIVICCTVLPGYISNVGSYLIEDCRSCTLSYNPEFIAQGEIMKGLSEPDVVLIGEGSKAVGTFYNHFTNQPRRILLVFVECLLRVPRS